MVQITEVNREPATTVSTLTATTEVTSPSVTADSLEAGGADTRFDWYHEIVGGTVGSGDAGPVWGTTLDDGESIQVTQAMFTTANLGAVPAGVDLVIADLTNDVSEVTLITGDGTIKDDETGSPLGSYQNNSGAEEQIGILMDNGNWNGGSGSDQDLLGSFIARVV